MTEIFKYTNFSSENFLDSFFFQKIQESNKFKSTGKMLLKLSKLFSHNIIYALIERTYNSIFPDSTSPS